MMYSVFKACTHLNSFFKVQPSEVNFLVNRRISLPGDYQSSFLKIEDSESCGNVTTDLAKI